jgi:hypothetical protein
MPAGAIFVRCWTVRDQAQQALAKADAKSGVRLQVDNQEGSELLFLKSDQG